MAFHGIVPVADIHRSAWSVLEIHRDETEVLREDQIKLVFFGVVIVVLDPLMELDAVCGLVANFDKTALHFFRPHWEVDKFVTADA